MDVCVVSHLYCYEQWGNEQGIHFIRVLSGMELLGYVIIQFYKIMLIVFQVGFNPFEFSAVFSFFFSSIFKSFCWLYPFQYLVLLDFLILSIYQM